MPSNTEPALWTVKQLMTYTQLSKGHIYRLTGEQRIPFVRVGNAVRFRKTDIDAWLDSRAVKPTR